VKHVKEEKEVMRMVDYPFFVMFRGSFQDDECVYIVMEYVPGGEFFTHLRDNGRSV
jgi:serine/threonine protein kinase